MNNDDRLKSFEKELSFIKNPRIKKFAEETIKYLPDYFFQIPASSTGKYHPTFSLGDGGLLRHTKAAIGLAVEMSRLEYWHFTSDELDLIIASIIPHDGWKSGIEKQKFSVAEHPNIAADMLNKNEGLKSLLTEQEFSFVIENVRRHMGQWNTSYSTGEIILDKPETKYQKFMHMMDYLASRKCIEFKFDVNIERE